MLPPARQVGPGLSEYLDLFRTPTFVYNTAGMAAVTFATGAYGAWGLDLLPAGPRPDGDARPASTIGALLVVASLIGIALGMFLADLLFKLTKRAYLLLAAFAVLGAIPLGATGILDPVYRTSLDLPVRCVGLDVDGARAVQHGHGQRRAGQPPGGRVRGLHLPDSPVRRHQLADPPGLDLRPLRQAERGRLADRAGSSPRSAPRPVDGTNLTVAMLSVVPVLALGCVFFLIGSRYLPADQEKVRAAGWIDGGRPGAVPSLSAARTPLNAARSPATISSAIRTTTVISSASMRWPPACWTRRS